ncbi:MAG: hypothetical protein Q8L15_16455 [Methylobacter sp.]|nr:hypothetical protein [Methylobacter sp.]
MEFEKFGSTIKTNPDGTLSVKSSSGAVITMGENGISIDLEKIESVGIKNVIDVETHSINTVVGSRSHFIKFYGGGEVRFAYNQAGRLIELSSTNVILSLSPDNGLIFSRRDDKSHSSQETHPK